MEFFAVPEGLHPNTANLVARFAAALAEKLKSAQDKYGYSDGWASPDWMGECRAHLRQHVEKGDPRDVAAYAAFLWHHGASTAQQSAAPDAELPSLQESDRDKITRLNYMLWIDENGGSEPPPEWIDGYRTAMRRLARPGAVDEDATRVEFERWVSKRHGFSTEKWADSGNYKYLSTRDWWECWKTALTAAQMPAEAGVVEMPTAFGEWFGKNYPGPDTIIHNPHWHAPRIWKAAMYALRSGGNKATAADQGEEGRE